jgi:hypothetical protein
VQLLDRQNEIAALDELLAAARDGRSGALIFISPRTVEYHLHKVFRKLEIAHAARSHDRRGGLSVAEVVHYEVVTLSRAGKERRREYVSDMTLAPGDVFRLYGRDWLVERVEPAEGDASACLFAKPARYRLSLRHPDGRVETGAFRRYRPDAPKLGHAFTTMEDGRPISWEVVDERLAYDEEGEPYLE